MLRIFYCVIKEDFYQAKFENKNLTQQNVKLYGSLI